MGADPNGRARDEPRKAVFRGTRGPPNGRAPEAMDADPNGRARDEPREAVFLGVHHDLERTVTSHLFVICPNNSGSTFLRQALATSRRTWNLAYEGGNAAGAVRPNRRNDDRLTGSVRIWAARKRWRDVIQDPAAYDWSRNRAAWYFQAYARDPRATVFVEKTPEHLLVVDALARHFRNARFLFVVRNPYAVCEGICRVLRSEDYGYPSPAVDGERLETVAARHVVACLEHQRRNVETFGAQGRFFTYETMCAEPERVARSIRDLAPELDDLCLRQRLPVHHRRHSYDEMLTDMNARQIARLDPGQVAAINRVLRGHRAVLEHFGYEIMDAGRASSRPR